MAKIVHVIEVDGDRTSRFTLHGASTDYPIWSPDGSRIVYATSRDGPFNLYYKPVAGGNEEPLFKSEDFKLPTDWSSDGLESVHRKCDAKPESELESLSDSPLNGGQEGLSVHRKPLQRELRALFAGWPVDSIFV